MQKDEEMPSNNNIMMINKANSNVSTTLIQTNSIDGHSSDNDQNDSNSRTRRHTTQRNNVSQQQQQSQYRSNRQNAMLNVESSEDDLSAIDITTPLGEVTLYSSIYIVIL